ncbi:MAG: 4a-hydroxytetrahydrobiopterin dehydratase [Gammaproteobacteria bacterium CG22_combo_CG10-13_8_21_14_all_40_8]|nr:MAG: 4a-hydroxytetrahydrobiopterin dehydratase [Gammaproteobacteria bacterium CG22_combo_CG10-13_8_21_14_all_40_8]
MSQLNQKSCEACHVAAETVKIEEMEALLQQIPEWIVQKQNGIAQLERQYHFKKYKTAVEFANSVANLAETENHHPALLIEWGKVQVSWWTHAIKGLHQNDFICAAKTDNLYAMFK